MRDRHCKAGTWVAMRRLRGHALAHCFLPLLVVLAAALVGCGSGSDGGPTAPLALTEAVVEDLSLALVNRARSEQGLGTLIHSEELGRIARDHSRAMRDGAFFGHIDPAGNGLRSRLESAGVSFSAAGENLALVSHHSDPAALAHQRLLASAEHRRVMLDARFVEAGVGVARAGDTFWITQVYLKP